MTPISANRFRSLVSDSIARLSAAQQATDTDANRQPRSVDLLAVYFDTTSFSAAEIAEILGRLSDVYEVVSGGDRLVVESIGPAAYLPTPDED